MATFYTDLTTRNNTGPTFANRIDDARRVERALQFTDAIWTIAGTETTNDLIYVCDLPSDSIVYPENSFYYPETSPGTTLTVSIGDLVDDDRYGASSVLGGQTGIVQFTTATKNVAGVVTRLEVSDATSATATTRQIYIKVISAATLSAGAKVHVKIAYKCF